MNSRFIIIHPYSNSLVTNHCIFFLQSNNNLNTDECNDEANVESVYELSQKKYSNKIIKVQCQNLIV